MKQPFIDKASVILLLIKMLLVVPFGVLLSTLVLYITHHLKLTDSVAANITASFIAYAGIVRLVGGYLANRHFSNRFLLCLSACSFIAGCVLIAIPQTFYLGITAVTIGSGLTIAVNCLLTEIFQTDYKKREAAFLYNYSGMNIGYIIAFSLSGYFELYQQYTLLFIVSSIFAAFALLVILFNYKTIYTFKQMDQNPIYSRYSISNLNGWLWILTLFIFLYIILQQEFISRYCILVLGTIIPLGIFIYGINQTCQETRIKLFTYLILSVPTLIFWTIYNLSPMALTLFVERNVNRHYLGLVISPQWVQLITTITVVIGGPILTWAFNLLRQRGMQINTSLQFSLALILIGVSLLTIPIGIYLSDNHGLTHFNWIILCFVLQGIAELLIAPVGFAIVGQYAPVKLQGIMMGNWLMLIGIGATLSSYISGRIFYENSKIDPVITNISYSQHFILLSIFSISTGIIMLAVLPFFLKLLNKMKRPLTSSQIDCQQECRPNAYH